MPSGFTFDKKIANQTKNLEKLDTLFDRNFLSLDSLSPMHYGPINSLDLWIKTADIMVGQFHYTRGQHIQSISRGNLS